jgi:hypothetical protein
MRCLEVQFPITTGLRYFRELAGKKLADATLIYGGNDTTTHQGCQVLPWHAAATW